MPVSKLIKSLLVFGIACTWADAAAARPDGREMLTPHKALYEIRMRTKKSSTQIVNISGQMLYEWQPGCDAWISDHRFRLRYDYIDSPPLTILSDFSTYETYDGQELAFTSRRKRNGETFQELRGHVIHDDNGGRRAIYTMPDEQTIALPEEAMFPMSHTLAVIEHAMSGSRFFNAVIFDGSDDDGPVEVNAFIARPASESDIPETGDDVDRSLLSLPAWHTRMAFFPIGDISPDPDYEMNAILHANGVISDMYVEYRDFSVRQNLVALEPVDYTPCDRDEDASAEKPPAERRWLEFWPSKK